jgi:hypothetical protein
MVMIVGTNSERSDQAATEAATETAHGAAVINACAPTGRPPRTSTHPEDERHMMQDTALLQVSLSAATGTTSPSTSTFG